MTDDLLARQIAEMLPMIMRTVSGGLRQQDRLHMTSHFHLLWLLEKGSFTLGELAERHVVSRPTMSNSVTILEERGWARRVRSHTDRRKVLVEITPQGREVLAHTRDEMVRRFAEVLGTLDTADREIVSQGLIILRDAVLQTMPPHPDCSQH